MTEAESVQSTATCSSIRDVSSVLRDEHIPQFLQIFYKKPDIYSERAKEELYYHLLNHGSKGVMHLENSEMARASNEFLSFDSGLSKLLETDKINSLTYCFCGLNFYF